MTDIANSYAQLADVAAYIYQLQESDEATVEAILPRASRIFDLACEQDAGFFAVAGETAAERTFTGLTSNYIRIGPFVGELSGVEADGTALTTDDYRLQGDYLVLEAAGTLVYSPGYLYPFQSSGLYAAPINTIRNVRLTSPYIYAAVVKATARWGYESVPADVVEAVLELTAAIWRSKDAAFMKLIDLDNQQIVNSALPPRVKMIADKYKERKALNFA